MTRCGWTIADQGRGRRGRVGGKVTKEMTCGEKTSSQIPRSFSNVKHYVYIMFTGHRNKVVNIAWEIRERPCAIVDCNSIIGNIFLSLLEIYPPWDVSFSHENVSFNHIKHWKTYANFLFLGNFVTIGDWSRAFSWNIDSWSFDFW